MTITTLNVSPSQIESYLLAGQTVDEIATEWQEPRVNVAAVLRQLQQDGRMPTSGRPPQNAVTPTQAPARPTPPRHIPAPEVKARIASATELLVRADSIEDKRIQGALGRARKAMTDLAGLVSDYEGKGEARRTVERLEQELREARAALRGGVRQCTQPQARCARRPRQLSTLRQNLRQPGRTRLTPPQRPPRRMSHLMANGSPHG